MSRSGQTFQNSTTRIISTKYGCANLYLASNQLHGSCSILCESSRICYWIREYSTARANAEICGGHPSRRPKISRFYTQYLPLWTRIGNVRSIGFASKFAALVTLVSKFWFAELPPSAAQDALPKNLILQHPKPPLPHKSSSNSFYERRPSSHSLHFTDRASPPNNTCPLPPISSISPANHGSPASQSSESELTSIQQQLALLEYFNNQTAQQVFSNSQQVFSPQSQSSPQDASHYSSMEYYYSDPTLCHAENVPIEHNNSQNSQPMSDEDISTLLDGWLMDNGPFSDNSSGDSIMGRPGELLAAADTDRSGQVSPFRHEEMQADAFQDTTHHMDVESFLNANSSVDSMFDMFFSDLANSANGGGNGGYMTGGQNLSGPLYWPESEQMLWVFVELLSWMESPTMMLNTPCFFSWTVSSAVSLVLAVSFFWAISV